jgi:hypothetical protein
VLIRTTVGGILFAAVLWLCWRLFIQRLWDRAEAPGLVAT